MLIATWVKCLLFHVCAKSIISVQWSLSTVLANWSQAWERQGISSMTMPFILGSISLASYPAPLPLMYTQGIIPWFLSMQRECRYMHAKMCTSASILLWHTVVKESYFVLNKCLNWWLSFKHCPVLEHTNRPNRQILRLKKVPRT